MWKTKKFKTSNAQVAWIVKNKDRYQIEVIFVNNGYACLYRKLRWIG